MNQVIDTIEKEQQKSDTKPFSIGDSVRVHTIVKEGDKERVQIFTGIVIGRKGRDIRGRNQPAVNHGHCRGNEFRQAGFIDFNVPSRLRRR